MIVPRFKLLFWVAIVVLPLGLITATQPGTAGVSLIVLGVFSVLCGVDARRSRRTLAGITVHLAPVLRMSKDRQATLEVRIRNEKPSPIMLRFAVELPTNIECPQPELQVNLPQDQEWSHFSLTCSSRRKGVFRINLACLGTSSPWGFWDAQTQVPVACELRVYPNLQSERKNVAALFLHRGSLGLHVQRQIGKGRDFEKLREYVPGDGFEDVHWKATAKRGKPVTKVFQIERTQEIYVVVDASRLSARTAGAPTPAQWERPERREGERSSAEIAAVESATALDRYIAAALVLGLAAEQQGDLFGLLTFSDKIERFVRAKNGKTHFGACRDAFYTLEPKLVTPDYEELFTFIRLRLRRRALLVFLTALDDPVLAESFVRNLELIRNQHLVLVNMLQPPGVGPVFEGAEPSSVDDLYQHLGGHLLWENLSELEKRLQRRGVKFSLLKDERLSLQLVQQYLSAKRRQAL